MPISLKDQLILKMKLERTFKPEIKRVFNSMLEDFRATLSATGVPLDANRYKGFWESIIGNHYRRTQKAFRKANKQNEDETILLALLAWRNEHAGDQAQFITNTNLRDQQEAIRLARRQFEEDGEFPTDTELALVAAAILRRKYSGRVGSIAMTETQASSEATKFIEAEVDAGLTPRILGGAVVATTAEKEWRTMGDNKVRTIHQRVNGQRKRLNEPFEVNGQLLMHPGDSSLGATPDNTANCRCMGIF